jgi:hypothetical protein
MGANGGPILGTPPPVIEPAPPTLADGRRMIITVTIIEAPALITIIGTRVLITRDLALGSETPMGINPIISHQASILL